MANKMRGLATLKIGGKNRPFKFGMNAMYMMCNKLDINISEVQNILSGESAANHILLMIYCGLDCGAHSKGVEIDFTQHSIGDWIDDCDDQEAIFTEVIEAITTSLGVGAKKK